MSTVSPALFERLPEPQSHSLPSVNITSKLSPSKRNMFHLRRNMKDVKYTREMELRLYHLFKQYQTSSSHPAKSALDGDSGYAVAKEMLIYRATVVLLDKVTRFGRNPEVVDVVLHSDQQGQMVSRLHAEITAEPDPEDPTKFSRYSIADKSLNGTYVNDRRAPTVPGELYLHKGDIIKFGHVNGASYKPGEFAIGNESEFIFTFEPAYDGMEYIGHTSDGNRIERKGPQAYIHLGAHSLLPHEFDLFSLVPKREADFSVIPYGAKLNTEQKRVEYIQQHAQLLNKCDGKQPADPSILHPGSFGSTSIPIPGVSNPAVIPNMTNFNLITDLARITTELQATSGMTNNDMLLNILSQYLKVYPSATSIPSTELLFLLQYLQASSHSTIPYFPQPTAPLTGINPHHLGVALNPNLLRNYVTPPASESVVNALRQIAGPYLNGHTSLPGMNGMSNGSGASIMQALYAALQPSMGAAAAAAAAAAVVSTSAPTMSMNSYATTELARQIFEEKRKQQIAESSPDGVASASSTTSEETIPTTSGLTRNPASDLLYHDSIATPQRYSSHSSSEPKPEKLPVNEKFIADIAKAAAAAAVGAHCRTSGETERKSGSGTTTANTTPVPRSAPTPSIKTHHHSKSAVTDHIQETIDSVAKRVTEKPSPVVVPPVPVVVEEPKPTPPEPSLPETPVVVAKPPRRRKKKVSENENGKSTETVLKILDDAVAKMEPEKPKLAVPKIEVHDPLPSPSTIIESPKIPEIDREQSSSGGSLIVCEAKPDDPGLNSPSVNLLAVKAPEELLDITPKVKTKGRKKKVVETETDSNDEEEHEIVKKYKKSRKHQHSNESASSDMRSRKKSSSVKSRVIRVPRSPISTYKKGPERLPGHKSNEVARLLYDLEGSYMHCARKGETKRDRKNTTRETDDCDTDDDEDSSRPSSSHQLPSKRKSSDRYADSPAKKAKDSQERENNYDQDSGSSDDDEEDDLPPPPPPKVNGEKRGRKPKDATKKRKNAKIVEIVESEPEKSDKSGSDSDDDEPTPKKKRPGRHKKESTKTPVIQKKKPGRQPASAVINKIKKKPGRKAKDKSTFVELTNNEWERCAMPGCKPPRLETTVNWVQCDDCDQWYHLICAFGRDDRSVLEEQFHCGCLKPVPTATATAVMA